MWREQFDAGCRQFYRQWQTIQAYADLDDGPGVGIGQLEVGLDGLGALEEECYCCIV